MGKLMEELLRIAIGGLAGVGTLFAFYVIKMRRIRQERRIRQGGR